MTAATWALFAYVIGVGLMGSERLPAPLDILWSWMLHWLVAAWVSDAQRRGVRLWYDSDSFLTFLWPVLGPVYLFKTRGVRAFIPIGWFIGMWVVAFAVAWVWEALS